jgi:biotin carboxyl carrier protein
VVGMKKKFKVTVEGKTFIVEIEEIAEEELTSLKSEALKEETSLSMEKPFQLQKKEVSEKIAEKAVIKAPIDGTITRIEKKLGEKVSAGEVVLILEAMKMENEICAPKSGVIKALNVSEGSSVHQGDVLAIIE